MKSDNCKGIRYDNDGNHSENYFNESDDNFDDMIIVILTLRQI